MSRPSPTRRSWLQFSLRGLLLVMSLVGVSLVVFRWAWVVDSPAAIGPTEATLQGEITEPFLRKRDGAVVKPDPPVNPAAYLNPRYVRSWREDDRAAGRAKAVKLRRQTTYRRGWNGKPEKHGVQRYWNEDGTLMAEIQYFNDEQRQINRLDANGKIAESNSYEDGVLQGPYFCRLGPRTWEGSFHQGKKAGEWQVTFRDGQEVIRGRQPWVDGKPHGDWKWTTGDDELLQSARYDRGRLVLWNGKPPHEELQRWCDNKRVDQLIQEALFAVQEKETPSGIEQYKQFRSFNYDLATLPLNINGRGLLLLHSPRAEPTYEFLDQLDKSPAAEQTIGEGIVQEALLTSRTLDFRFGVTCVVPICSSEVHWQDRTGVRDVQFPKGSLAALSWSGIHTPDEHRELYKQRDCLYELTRLLGLAITVDTLEFEAETLSNGKKIGSICSGRRRDIVGLFLASNGWSCEQRDNMLILHPWQKK